MVSESAVDSSWFGFQNTLRNLGLIDKRLSVTPDYYAMYKVKFANNYMPWEVNFNVTDEEEDEENIEALESLRGVEVEVHLLQSMSRILGF